MSIPPPPPPDWGKGNPAEELARAKHFYAIGKIESVEALEELLDKGKVFERLAEDEELHAQYLATFPAARERERESERRIEKARGRRRRAGSVGGIGGGYGPG